jgi:hypothetical protein
MKGSRGFSGLAILAAVILAVSGGIAERALGVCGPFTDVAADAFCPFVLELFTLAITTGTTPTTYDPGSNVSRLQMAAFLSRTVDGVLKRGSRRAALRQFWTTQTTDALPMTTLHVTFPENVEFDGADLWVAARSGGVDRVRASDGSVVENWTVDNAGGVAIAMGKVFIASQGATSGMTGRLMRVDPSQPAGAATTVATSLPWQCFGVAFDGGRLWTANQDGTVSIVTPGASLPWTVTTTAGGYQRPFGILYDGSNIWITDAINNVPVVGTLLKLSSSGAVLQTVTVGVEPVLPVFDGSNIWVPNLASNSISVVRASSGAVLATLTGLPEFPVGTAFDGQRVLVTSQGTPLSVSLWKAADLTPLGSFPLPSTALSLLGAASDGASFWIPLTGLGGVGWLARF